MNYKRILILLTVSTLSLTACGKTEPTEAPTETVVEETSEDMDTLTNADRGEAVGEIIDNTEINEDSLINTPDEYDPTAFLDGLLASGELSQELYDELKGVAVDPTLEMEDPTQQELDKAKERYESGELTEEEYNQYVQFITGEQMDPIEFPEGEDTYVDVPFSGWEDQTDWSGESDIEFGKGDYTGLEGKHL